MEAYRYPEDYNGISSMAPANPWSRLMIGSLWSGYVTSKDDAHRVTMAKINAVQKAFINQCDEKDGLKDGIVSDPEYCSFDPGIIQCKEGDGNDCLTAPQVEAMREVYAGAKKSTHRGTDSCRISARKRTAINGSHRREGAVSRWRIPISVMLYSTIRNGITNPLITTRTLPRHSKSRSDILDVPEQRVVQILQKWRQSSCSRMAGPTASSRQAARLHSINQ